jgi:chaperonin GroES
MQNDSGFKPTGDIIVVRLRKVEEKTSGGIVLPGSVTDKHQLAETTGQIVAMGQTASAHPRMFGIDVGDNVLFPRYSGHHFPMDGVDYWIMEAKSILGRADKLPDYLLKGADSTKEVFGANEPNIKDGQLVA